MTPSTAPAWLTQLFAAVLQVAGEINAVNERAVLLELMAQLRPGQPEIAAMRAWVMLQQGDSAGARTTLERIDHEHPGHAIIKALLAYCLHVQRDSLWQAYVHETLALPLDSASTEILKVIAAASGTAFHGLEEAATSASVSESHHLNRQPIAGLSC
ncbi:HrpB1 family type III secretion system apparatus protein [Paucibacter sp. PLA-PC-4]|uniref:HrpB1 family type III secretion system apparatus protein n=1 Tax=Paucibacter sp. PLA-PC-4 TaxID=2993655 RepID=UPI00224B59A3|nr:HrpB1 family type III secretion system apparatus protein [Paucibacter sp. PLA-PC-4]MCX2865597.1 HrpB1 family type III secretion system apparatus protein [Paucibacter sp. PLA-PC-4]